MKAVRALARLCGAALHLLRGLATVLWLFPRATAAQRQRHIQRWSAGLLRLLGIRLQQSGEAWPAGGTLLVANHVSWLDIIAIHAVCPAARFVSKADVKQWPLVGRLVAGAGTLFIERERKRDALRVVHHIAEALRAGDVVAVFPEGTTSDGASLLPFHANLLQAAIAVGAPVQPVVLCYVEGGALSTAAPYVGEMTLVGSLWRIACAQGLSVRLRVLPPQPGGHADRRALAELLHGAMAGRLRSS